MNLETIRISPLTSKDSIRDFKCGESEIDKWVTSKAFKWVEQTRTKVFIAHDESNRLAKGLFSLSFSTEDGRKLTGQDRQIWGRGVPLVYLGYLAVQRNCQGAGIGTLLLIDCLRRASFVSSHVAFYGVGLRSLNEKTTSLYQRYGFAVAPGEDRYPLMILPIWTLNDLFS